MTATVALPSPPFIVAPGLANLRDAGGYAVTPRPGEYLNGAMVKRGVLYRSADLTMVGEEAIETLCKLKIQHVFDLRSIIEIGYNKPEEETLETVTKLPESWTDAERVFVPVFLDQDYSAAAIATRFSNYSNGVEGFVLAYASILEAAASPENPYAPFRTILEHLASDPAPPAPMLVHCTAGKDRTGIFIALVLSLCGVPDEVVAHEYSLTDIGLLERREKIITYLTPKLGDRPRAEMMVTSKKEYMIATLKMMRTKYGDAETYLVDHCRIERDLIERVRRNLVVEIDPAEDGPIDWQSHAELLR